MPPGHDPLFLRAEAQALGNVIANRLPRASWTARRALRVALEPAAVEALKTTTEFTITDLRSIAVQGLVEAEHLPALAEGKALLSWHARHRFCPNCGATDPRRSKPAGGATARPARCSIFRAPIRS